MACYSSGKVSPLKTLALTELTGILQNTVAVPLSNRNICKVATYLVVLPSKLRSTVLENTLLSRPMWVPIDYHWASLELDPLLTLLSVEDIGSAIREFMYPCHPLNRESLLRALGVMTSLRSLTLEESCDNEILGVVGTTCSRLVTLNVSNSKQVNDDGVKRLCLKRNVYMRSKWQNVAGRLKGLSFKFGSSHHSSSYHQLPPPKNYDPEDMNPCVKTLQTVNITGTKVSELGIMYLKVALPKLSMLITE